MCNGLIMIKTFSCKKAEAIWKKTSIKGISLELQNLARRKLRMLNNAEFLEDLRPPPGNKLEPLLGDRKGQCSIRVNHQWRLCFRWEGKNAHDVHIVDYH